MLGSRFVVLCVRCFVLEGWHHVTSGMCQVLGVVC